MIKKWSYVVAAAATVFGGSILTGCIDNDEPFGITQIRVETANLLKAKQALVEADAALKQAQADLDRTALEIQKIQLENEKAKAAAEAELAKLNAEAENARQNAMNEVLIAEIQARIDDMKARTEAELNAKAEQLRVAIERQEIINKNLQLKYDKLAYEWEQTKLKDALNVSTPLWKALDYAYNQYLYMLAAYNTLADNLTTLQRAEAQWLNNLYYDDESKTWKHPQDEYKDLIQESIDKANNDIADATSAKERLAAEIEEFKTFQNNPDGIYAKWQSLKEELTENAAAKANNEIKQKELEGTPAYIQAKKEKEAAEAAVSDYENKHEIAIPAYTFEADPSLGVLGIETTEIVKPNTTYTLAEVNANPAVANSYDDAVTTYDNLIKAWKSYLLDENQADWTLARVEELKRQISPLQKAFDDADAMWVNAKAVYNNGGTVDATALAGEEALEAAIKAYNALQTKYADLAGKFKTANKESADANKAYADATADNAPNLNKAWNDAKDAYDAAIEAADDALEKATEEADAALAKVQQAGVDAVTQAQMEVTTAENLVKDLDAKFEDNKTNATYLSEKKAAEAKVTQAKAALAAAQAKATADNTAEEAKKNNAVVAANIAWAKARYDAKVKLDAAHKAWVAAGEGKPELAALAAAAEAKKAVVTDLTKKDLKALNDEYADLLEKLNEAYNDQFDQVKTTINNWVAGTTNLPLDDASATYTTSVENGTAPKFVKAMDAPITYMADGVYVNAKWYLIASSDKAYGNLFTNATSGITVAAPKVNEITAINLDPAAFLTATVNTDTLNKFVRDEKNDQSLQPWKCVEYYSTYFAAYGALATAQNTIKVAEAQVQSSKLSEQTVGTLETQLAAVKKTLTDAEAEKKKLDEVVTAKTKAFTALSTDLTDEFTNLENERKLLEGIVEVIEEKFYYLNDFVVDGNPITTPEALQGAVEALTYRANMEQQKIDNATAALKEAEANLALLENGNAEYTFNPFATRIKNTQAELSLAEEKLAAYKARLDEVQAKYEAAAKQ